MGDPKTAERSAALRMLPSIDELLAGPELRAIASEVGRRRMTSLARSAIDSIREELVRGLAGDARRESTYSRQSLLEEAVQCTIALWLSHRQSRLRRVINATGVIIHTNLGRAPLSTMAVRAIQEAAGYCTVEYDLESGRRGKRGAQVEKMLAELTGADAALVVNNCAAAAFLVLTVLAKGGEVIVSRGELVEIGGDFRIPDVLVQSGATLKEIGTTNRTKLADYEKAIGDDTRLLMSVHPSNYRIIGFTDKPSRRELAELARRKKILYYEDAGSGALLDLGEFDLEDEPVIQRVVADGVDVVTFSGDKLLGGSQAGLIVGRQDIVEKIRRHPLYRALRVDKLICAALEATLEAYHREDAVNEVPVLQMIAQGPEELDRRVREFALHLKDRVRAEVSIELIDGESVVGGGSAPEARRRGPLVAMHHASKSTSEFESALRKSDPPIIGRIENDLMLVDLRTVRPEEEPELLEAIVSAAEV